MEDIDRTIIALTSLIEVNSTRAQVYQSLANKMRNDELRSLFIQYAEQSKQFANALSTWRSAYGGFGLTKKNSNGNVWTHVTSLLDHWLGKKVASKCEELEREALRQYRAVIQMPFLPSATAADIERQSREFDKALTRIRTLREQGTNTKIREELVHTVAF